MIEADAFISELRLQGHTFVSGVPCSFLKPFINRVIDSPDLDYVPASSEGEAVGITLGAHLAGRKTVSLCQNSGLGNMVNPLTSLNFPFRIPTLLITTWRGEPGRPDEPQHELMGQITQQLLELMRIPQKPFPQAPADMATDLADAVQQMNRSSLPFAFVMRKGTIAPAELETAIEPKPLRTKWLSAPPLEPPEISERPSREASLSALLETVPHNAALIATTGKTGRELYTIDDREQHLYVVGGMGTASAIALGVALNRKSPVIAIDGDGAALMKLGTLATVGSTQPENLLHVILDNEVHDSTGGQSTTSGTVNFAEIAAAANYRHVAQASDLDSFRAHISEMLNRSGPNLLHLKIAPGSIADLGRPKETPEAIKARFMNFLAQTP